MLMLRITACNLDSVHIRTRKKRALEKMILSYSAVAYTGSSGVRPEIIVRPSYFIFLK